MRRMRDVFLLALGVSLLFLPSGFASDVPQVKLSVFNYGALNMEASGYGTTVTNMLISSLRGHPSLNVLDRKELEAFLSLNDLQQNDALDNVLQIGSRLGLDFVVAGSVGKSGSIITVNSKVVSIEQRRVILHTQSKALGDADLASETRKLSDTIVKTIMKDAGQRKDGAGTPGAPVNLVARPGNMSVYLRWEDPSGYRAAGYKVDRGLSEAGPFTRIAQVQVAEYVDQGLEKKTTYYYRLRAYDDRGIQTGYSAVAKAETAPTPFPPIILKAEGHIKSIHLTWSANPGKSDDPAPLRGFKIYRTGSEKGPFKEVVKLMIKDAGTGSTSDGESLGKITHTDKGLADGEEYAYRITAYNENNLESNFSEPIKGSTTPPVGKVSIQGDMIREIRLSWSASDSPFVKGYYLYRSLEEGKGFTRSQKVEGSRPGGDIVVTDLEGLGDKTRYYYQVTAYEETDVETNPSQTASAVTRGKPPVPKGLKAESGLVKKVQLSWSARAEEEVLGYKLYRSKTKEGNYEFIKKISDRASDRVLDEGGLFGFGKKIEDGTAYFYVLTAYNKVDVESDVSDVASATTKARPKPPAGLAGSIQDKKAFLVWKQNAEPDIVSYTVYESGPSGLKKIETVKGDVRFSEAAPEPGKKKTYVVTAKDKDDLESDPSLPFAVDGQ